MIESVKDRDIKTQLVFCQKRSISGKTRKTKYNFYGTNLDPNLEKDVGEFLKKNVEDLDEYDIIDQADDNLDKSLVKVDNLDDIINWKEFSEEAFTESREVTSLKDIKKDLNCFVIYYKDENKVIGQIRRVWPRNVLLEEENDRDNNKKISKKRIFISDEIFKKMEIKEDLTIDNYFDFMFLFEYESEESEDEEEKLKIGLINNCENYYSIFDLDIQFANEAKEIISSCSIFNNFEEPTKVKELIEGDRVLQRTLRNQICREAFESIKEENLIEIKSALNDNVNFDIDGTRIILPEEESKKALKEFVRAVGRYYNKSIYGDSRIIEGKPVRII
ncbi:MULTISPECIES: hypothetical protein [Methanobacterium]|uniref:DUF4868 domain-containing protein n=1 Tax=Methanobacterium veterum TaxID=408577 RepID=A0A9E4ZYU9_9EURY|nr:MULTISPECIES: hypothetical protein [Methanobacterium]MCZ3366621.1 hypothetical protein [Methanobacterium veterum]MCZ3374235.1 hypothetical protein [Methanobacterium veterum]